MKVDQPNLRETVFDCPWIGHLYDDRFRLRNSSAPNVLGMRCVKCGCLIYELIETSPIVGPGGESLPKPEGVE